MQAHNNVLYTFSKNDKGEVKAVYIIVGDISDDLRVSSQVADGSTRRRVKSSRDIGELVLNPVKLITR